MTDNAALYHETVCALDFHVVNIGFSYSLNFLYFHSFASSAGTQLYTCYSKSDCRYIEPPYFDIPFCSYRICMSLKALYANIRAYAQNATYFPVRFHATVQQLLLPLLCIHAIVLFAQAMTYVRSNGHVL